VYAANAAGGEGGGNLCLRNQRPHLTAPGSTAFGSSSGPKSETISDPSTLGLANTRMTAKHCGAPVTGRPCATRHADAGSGAGSRSTGAHETCLKKTRPSTSRTQ
jgi:hypothetical protein